MSDTSHILTLCRCVVVVVVVVVATAAEDVGCADYAGDQRGRCRHCSLATTAHFYVKLNLLNGS